MHPVQFPNIRWVDPLPELVLIRNRDERAYHSCILPGKVKTRSFLDLKLNRSDTHVQV